MAEGNGEKIFEDCNNKLKTLKLSDIDQVNHTIDKLNALNYRNLYTSNEIAEDLFLQMVNLIPIGNDHLVSKFCSLIYLYLNKQEKILSKICTSKLTEFHLVSLQNCGEWLLNDILIALSALFYRNGDKIEKYHKNLLGTNGVLIDLATPSKHEPSVQYHAFQCIVNLLTHCNNENYINPEYLEHCCQHCISVMKKQIELNSSDVLSLKILISSVKCFQFLYTTKNIYVENFGELLGILKCLLFYGLPGPSVNDFSLYPTLHTPDSHLDSQGESDSTTHPKLRKQKRTRRTRSKRPNQKKDSGAPNEDNFNYNHSSISKEVSNAPTSSPSSPKVCNDIKIRNSSSDSEFSDAENCASKVRSLQASVRQNAYQALQVVVKNTDKKIMFGYWSSFLPDHPAIPGMAYGQNIFSTILKDPASQVRLSALVLLTEMLKGSKKFLSFADGRSARHSSFTSLSSIIATVVSELHRCLLLALLSENNNMLLTQIMKCYAVLCENSPYNKISDEILLKLLKNLKKFLHHKDTQVQVACLTVFCSIVNSDLIPEEIGQLLISADFDSKIDSMLESSLYSSDSKNPASEIPWIVQVCMKNIFSDEPLPVQIESLQLLSGIVGKYFPKISFIINKLEAVILFCLNKEDTSLQLHGAKLLDVFGRCLANFEIKSEEQQNVVKRLWHSVLNGPLNSCVTNDSQKTLLAVSCDCLSTLPSFIFEELSSKQQIFYITVLLGLASDTNPNVRGAAIRCLGVYSLFPCLMKFGSFLSDVSDILIKAVEDPNVNVRFKASWSFGNLSDALFLDKSQSRILDELSENFFYSTGMACVQYSKDCDRVRTNSVRALGNFLYYLPDQYLASAKIHHFIKSATTALISALSANVMKVCWNSCYALGKMLKNSSLVHHEVVELEVILSSLLALLRSPNFKVRISAAQALTVMQSRDLYGKNFPRIWIEILASLFSTATDVNFKEIKHQENLSDQLCYSVCQLVVLAREKDFEIISSETLQASEMLLTSMWKFGTRTTQDKIEEVCKALEYLNSLHFENNETSTQSVNILQDILNQVPIAFYGRDNN